MTLDQLKQATALQSEIRMVSVLLDDWNLDPGKRRLEIGEAFAALTADQQFDIFTQIVAMLDDEHTRLLTEFERI